MENHCLGAQRDLYEVTWKLTTDHYFLVIVPMICYNQVIKEVGDPFLEKVSGVTLIFVVLRSQLVSKPRQDVVVFELLVHVLPDLGLRTLEATL